MLASTTASVHTLVTPSSLAASSSHQAFPSSVLSVVRPRFRRRQERWFVPLSFVLGGGSERRCALLGFYRRSGLVRDCERGLHCGWSGFVRRCKDWDCEGDFALEAEILEFMKSSEKPDAFPSRKELVDAGRMDLAEAIVKRGGWLSMGWDLEEEGGGEGREDRDFDSGFVTAEEFDGFQKNSDWTGEEEVVSSSPYDYSNSASSSGRSLERANTSADRETGIEGILSRLEKERSLTFGFGVAEHDDRTFSASNNGKDDLHSGFSSDATVSGCFGGSRSSSLSSKKATFDESRGRFNQSEPSDVDSSKNSHKPESWRAWSIQRAGLSDINPEVIEISSSETSREESVDIPKDEELWRASDSDPNERNELGLRHELINHNELRSRLQHLQIELSSVLQAVRSNADESASQKDHDSSSDDLQTLSDAWEFQENEIMNSQYKLRSMRARLAVLEGKTALAIIDAQKIVEEKQKRIDNARRALRLLRPACIVWPNSASEVLLAGSFDGWATQIKFIVDGEWRIDPLRPIVMNNGHQNNLLIIT
ncbi:hypothetical protein L484_021075 [Morus notabilis]|uniref:AMP-activated protein kinase glycogen-binding domain-containing protein n=1 Tax=Morus notabilis TaxID=981085 RepID=W9RBZ9_9ROSA|nr:hypothetical protein L484_021075 [Morus notabilis]